MTSIIGSFAIKGGVGKTATVVNLAYLAACEGARTLVWDLDPQGAVSFYYRMQPAAGGGVKSLLRERGRLAHAVRSTDYANLDLIPADPKHRKLERLVHQISKPHQLLAARLKTLRHDYDFVFLDCPAGYTRFTQSVLRCLDALIIPIVPTTLSMRTWEQLLAELDGKRSSSMQLLPFFSMCDRRKQMHREIMDSELPGKVSPLTHGVPYAVDVERMGVKRQPVDRFASTSDAAMAYRGMWDEIKLRMAAR
ncbi:MAG: ParA family protein [Pseudomonadota bacterium]